MRTEIALFPVLRVRLTMSVRTARYNSRIVPYFNLSPQGSSPSRTDVSNFDQMCEQYRTDARTAAGV